MTKPVSSAKEPTSPQHDCDCCDDRAMNSPLTRRTFLGATAGTAVTLAASGPLFAEPKEAAATEKSADAESLVKQLYETMTEEQQKDICFDWDHKDERRGLLRTFVANNWNVTRPEINSKFYTDDQRDLIRAIYEDLIHPDWHQRYDKHLEDDAGGYGRRQSIAIFGKPGEGKFEFVMTGRHMTLRADGNSADHVAFGGPIFYGHAAQAFNEKPDHPGNVFWPQALAANKLYQMLDGKQQDLALAAKTPREQAVGFRGAEGQFDGIPTTELTADQKDHLKSVLQVLVEPFRQTDRDEVATCLEAQGGLDKCHLVFYSDRDLGGDKVWDNWRLEGPSFVWAFRGAPHVHCWVNVADDPSVELNA